MIRNTRFKRRMALKKKRFAHPVTEDIQAETPVIEASEVVKLKQSATKKTIKEKIPGESILEKEDKTKKPVKRKPVRKAKKKS